ncbi:MAG TPA: FdtA/QdtA family cupin domain-containing protein [Spirochaetota bacterium]|nr:FdtA/QdtA family cupin domain-containing protein [Spirochaetota bacterium]HOL57275.1 FdtA/QdtA family cupin domain-containing protein [Spirochaetota bacterium]HPP04851.1 FdtA/QdtA family cupin domain-containing protein [Spirochaetota bacterium]
MENRVRLISFKSNTNENGSLIAIENNRDIPFEIKRIFYIYGAREGTIRGKHANKNSKMVIIAINGSCTIKTYYQNKEEIFRLNSKDQGLFTDRMVWKEMYDFSNDCVLLILTDSFYDPYEYITDFDYFKRLEISLI